MPVIHVTDRHGSTHDVVAPEGAKLMFVLRDEAGLQVEGICGGCMVCGTCHVLIDADWVDRLPAPSGEELDMLDSLARLDPRRSRLSCQIVADASVDGLRLTLAPEE